MVFALNMYVCDRAWYTKYAQVFTVADTLYIHNLSELHRRNLFKNHYGRKNTYSSKIAKF